MGDRFYMAQKNYKPGRRLKKDIIAQLHTLLGQEVKGLDRLTIKTLDELTVAIAYIRSDSKFHNAYKELAK